MAAPSPSPLSPASGPPQLSSTTAILESILPPLRLAKAAVTGIGVPGVEVAVNGVCEVAEMISTMKANKEDLSKLANLLDKLIAINTSGTGGDLKQRLTALSADLREIAVKCKSLAEKNRFKQFWKGSNYKQRIEEIKNSVAAQTRQFTFYGNISIEKSVDTILNVLILSKLKTVPAHYNAENTPDRCMENTRVDIIQDIVTRLTSASRSSHQVVMLSGVAGSGKSTIAKSVASVLAETEHLAASFFFSRDYKERKEIKHLATMLAIQLAEYDSVFRTRLIHLLQTNSDGVIDAEPHLQFQKMVVDILENMPPSSEPWIICLDALDECGMDRGQIFLRWLSDSISRIPKHIRFFLTGRPDVPSCLKFHTLKGQVHGIILDIDAPVVTQDIYVYVQRSLDGSNWTTPRHWKIQSHDVEQITSRARGLFVFAATAVRYVLAGVPQAPPQESVDYLLSGEPLTDLHTLYHRIVNDAIPKPIEGDRRAQVTYDRSMKLLSTILLLHAPLDSQSLAGLLDMNKDLLLEMLMPLSAVIHVSDIPGVAIRPIHLSFREFIISRVGATRPDLICGTEVQQRSLADALMKLLCNQLTFNICHLPTSYLRNVDMPNFQGQLDEYISGHLRYASQFWVDHLTATGYSSIAADTAEKLLFQKFLFWLEVLSLLGIVNSAPAALSKLLTWANENFSLVQFATDAQRFVAFFHDPIIESTPHIYISALALAPTQSEIGQKFHPHFPRLLAVERGQVARWPRTIAVLQGHQQGVKSVAFAPDGQHIVSGSSDKTIRIWDAVSGAEVGERLEGHTNCVNSVAFSPDGQLIVSGSDDYTLRIWDAESGTAVNGLLEGHTDSVRSVAFSPDGKHIVSGSDDTTVRIWDAMTGGAVGAPLDGHTDWVRSVAWSTDGKHIVSGSNDRTVCIWDAMTGAMVGEPLEGHTGYVQSVGFSPDGKHIVSGSADTTVRIWDATTGAAFGEPLEGHPETVRSVAFSSNGKHIVSGSDDRIVRIWDARTGVAVGEPLEGHTEIVRSVAFSPDGKHIVSASDDRTVHIWDTITGAVAGEPLEGHIGLVTSVAFSLDGKLIVSGSDDGTVHIWDAMSGAAVGAPLKGHTTSVQSVAFSPNGQLIVSGSNDRVVCIWNAITRAAVGEPLKGHTGYVQSVGFSPDGKHIVSGSADATVRIWDATTGAAVGKPLEGHTDWIRSVAFSSDGKHIVSGSRDRTVRMWDAMTGAVVGEPLEGHTDWVHSVAFSPNGKHIVSGSDDKTVRVWDARTGAAFGEPLEGHSGVITSVAFSPDGKHIVSGSSDQTARIWDATTGAAVGTPLEGHTDWIRSVAFSTDGKHIVSGSDDHTLRIWDMENIINGPIISACHGNPDGSALLKSIHSKSSQIPLHWQIQSGWASYIPAELLFWVPSHHRPGFWSPYNTLVIGQQQTKLSYDNFVHGRNWAKCYEPRDGTAEL